MARNNAELTIIDKVRNTFTGTTPGTILTTQEIIDRVLAKYPDVNRTSVIPSDYCYNMTNKDKESNPRLAQFKIFEQLGRGTYIYRGEKYSYNGPIHRNPRRR
ncbi:DUF7225 domain-containing protein [Sulfobacillus thermosulfidooxidans]|uniref:DUF7225 domain-containing protein n=1 Tax=Sulfobacillus thermosulfidooxidans TaxID=28034 RepID=UPI0003680DF2